MSYLHITRSLSLSYAVGLDQSFLFIYLFGFVLLGESIFFLALYNFLEIETTDLDLSYLIWEVEICSYL